MAPERVRNVLVGQRACAAIVSVIPAGEAMTAQIDIAEAKAKLSAPARPGTGAARTS